MRPYFPISGFSRFFNFNVALVLTKLPKTKKLGAKINKCYNGRSIGLMQERRRKAKMDFKMQQVGRKAKLQKCKKGVVRQKCKKGAVKCNKLDLKLQERGRKA